MKRYRDVQDFKVNNPIVTIGSFDGVHLGHLKVIDRLRKIARDQNGETVVFTFDPHPRQILHPAEKHLHLLTTTEEKTALLEKAGVEHLIIYPFTKEFAELSYADFVRDILVGRLNLKVLVVGHDHKFGKNREGTFTMLKDLSVIHHFTVEKLDALLIDHLHISSTRIRNALLEGAVEKANQYLGYRFQVEGKVIEGQKLGRRIQFPTANIRVSDPQKIIPRNGVYACYPFVNGKSYKGMLNIGTRPTVNSNPDDRSMEVHLLDFRDNLYDESIRIEFVRKIRDEQKFESIELLRAQLEKDKQTVRQLL